MTQAQYAAIVARQRQMQQSRMPSQKEVKPQEDLKNDSNENAVNAIRELNEKVSQREKQDKELVNAPAPPSAIPQPVPPSNFPPSNFPETNNSQRMPMMSSRNVANNIRQNINMKKDLTDDDIEAANELHSNYDKLENVKIEVVEKEPATTQVKQENVTAAAVKNFEMIFNNTNGLLEKYKSHAALLEKQNENISTSYERKLRSNEVTIEKLTNTINELTNVIKGLTEKIDVLNMQSAPKPTEESVAPQEVSEKSSEEVTNEKSDDAEKPDEEQEKPDENEKSEDEKPNEDEKTDEENGDDENGDEENGDEEKDTNDN